MDDHDGNGTEVDPLIFRNFARVSVESSAFLRFFDDIDHVDKRMISSDNEFIEEVTMMMIHLLYTFNQKVELKGQRRRDRTVIFQSRRNSIVSQ